jgi:MFS transporter, FSR family, fosmidomycin resistance protein
MENKNLPNKTAIGVLSAAHLFIDAYGGFIIPLLPLIAGRLNISLSTVGLLLGISSIASSFSQPFFGHISDFIKKRFFIIWGMIFATVFISMIGISSNIWFLGTVVFLGNIGVGLYHPQSAVFTMALSGREMKKYIGLYTACGTLGYAFGPFLSSLLVENFGLRSTIYAVIPGLMVAFLMYTILPKIPSVIKSSKPKGNAVNILKFRKVIYLLVFAAIIRAVVIISNDVFMPFLWQKHNVSIFWTGTFIALFSFFGGIASYISGRLSNRYDSRLLLALSFLPAIPCLLGAIYLMDKMPVMSFISFVISGLIIMSSSSVNMVMAQKAMPENAGIIAGLIGGFTWGVAGLMQYPIGFLAAKFGIIPTLTIVAFTPILGALAISFIPEEHAY